MIRLFLFITLSVALPFSVSAQSDTIYSQADRIFQLGEVNITGSKAFASILYDVNTMGGVINLVFRKPAEKFEINGKLGIYSCYRWNVNAGSGMGSRCESPP